MLRTRINGSPGVAYHPGNIGKQAFGIVNHPRFYRMANPSLPPGLAGVRIEVPVARAVQEFKIGNWIPLYQHDISLPTRR